MADRTRWRVRQPSPPEQSQQGDDDGRAIFYELEKQPVGFFVSGVVHGDMARGVSMIFFIARFGSP
jgi:hypothetical protein